MKSEIIYLSDSILIEDLRGKVAVAQEGIMASVAETVKSYVLSQYDKNHPVASVVAFLGPGLLFKLGFPMLSVLYEVAEALGFDWKSFWTSVGSGIGSFVKTIVSSKSKASDEDTTSKINEVVTSAFESNFSGAMDQSKLMDIAQNKKMARNDSFELKSLATKYNDPKELIKNAGILSIFKFKLGKFFIKTISWLVKTALISLGFASVAGIASSFFHGDKDSSESEESEPGSESSAPKEDNISPTPKIQLSPNVSQELFQVHQNNTSDVWIEHGDINSIDGLLKSWVLNMYPQLNEVWDKVDQSSAYQNVINRFQTRNRLASGLGIISIPRPFQRKSDIVSVIVNGFLKEYHPDQQNNSSNNTSYK